MSENEKAIPFKRKKQTVIWSGLQNTTSRLYNRILRSPVGKLFTSYRSFSKGILGGGRRTDNVHSISNARATVLRAAESGRIFGALRQLGSLLLSVPVNFYGLFCFISAALMLAGYFLLPLTPLRAHMRMSSPIPPIAIMLMFLPLCISGKPTYISLGKSSITRLIIVRFLGIPEESLTAKRDHKGVGFIYFAFFLIPVAAFLSLKFSPWIVPLAVLFLGLFAMILSVPESGVILACAMLPFIEISEIVLYVVMGVIIIVWISYFFKLLRMHRRMRFDLLDVMVLVFGMMIFIGGFSGSVISLRTLHDAGVLFVLLSVYFLIVNLMAGRAYLKRCLVGVLLGVILALILGFAGHISPDGMDWIAGSYAGDRVSNTWKGLVEFLTRINADAVLLVTFTFPLAIAACIRCRRVIGKVGMIALLLANTLLIITSWSRGAWLCLAAGIVIFFLIYSHTALSVAVIALPAIGCGVWWLYGYSNTFKGNMAAAMSHLFDTDHYSSGLPTSNNEVWSDAWDMILHNPLGIGVGADALGAVYPRYATGDTVVVSSLGNTYLDILAALGFFGLAVLICCAFLLIQKACTAIRHTATSKERWVLLGGVASIAVLLMMCAVRSITDSMGVYLAIWIIVGVISGYANITFEESDVLRSVNQDDGENQDKVFHVAD